MIWLGLGLVSIAVALAYSVRAVLGYLEARAAEVEEEPPPPRAPRRRPAADDDEADDDWEDEESMLELIRTGPAGQEMMEKLLWCEERRREGWEDDDIEAALRNREPILRL